MILKKTFKFRLDPNQMQEKLFAKFSGACRWVYNRGLAQKKQAWEKDQRSISLFDQNKELSTLKTQEETNWLKDIHSQILQQSLHDLNNAYNHFFRRIKQKETPGYPRFRCRGEKDSFRYPQGVKVSNQHAYLPKIGRVKYIKSREIEGKIKQTTIIKQGKYWYICFSCEIEKTIPPIQPTTIIGIDLGIEHFATLATTNILYIDNPRFLNKELNHLRYLSRQLSQKHNQSKNWHKAKAKLQTFHAKAQNMRKDFLHKQSTTLVKNHDIIVVESLQVKELLIKAHPSLARNISDAGWRQFLEMLRYKSLHLGKKFIEAKPYFPSTKLCSQCGKVNTIELTTRKYQCSCGLNIHRDANAALNLKAVGMPVLKACGAAL